MSGTNVLIKKPRKIKFLGRESKLYTFSPIVSKPSDDYDNSTIEYLTPKVIASRAGHAYIFFNNNHPNVNKYAYKYGKDYYASFCLGGLHDEILALWDHKKFPEILYNLISEYSDSGYWYLDGSEEILATEKCIVCGRIPYGGGSGSNNYNYCGCPIVDKDGHYLNFTQCETKKFSWSKKYESFVYKGKINDDN